jgi:hypothetical protein
MITLYDIGMVGGIIGIVFSILIMLFAVIHFEKEKEDNEFNQ